MSKLISYGFVLLSTYLFSAYIFATQLSLATAPIFTGSAVAPMMMLVMGRDHTLYYEAYNDAADLTGNGSPEIHFNPLISYEGYFDSGRCYSTNNDKSLFSPEEKAPTCTVANRWSGNFLNYLTMTRMDLLRKILYGGYRSVDGDDQTVLERVYIPQDAHSWAKSYTSVLIDGYDISDYTPFTVPNTDAQHFFGTTTYGSVGSAPILRVRENVSSTNADSGVWTWASSQHPVLAAAGTDYTVRVSVCNAGKLEHNCETYTDSSGVAHYKPIGLLHEYGENDDMLFGLLTGSYNGNLSGGVLRQPVSKFSEEINKENGQFNSSTNGIVATINHLRIHGFSGWPKYEYGDNCGWVTKRALNEGECASWGNPIGEMLYESLRYFAGAKAASVSYSKSGAYDSSLGLSAAVWDDPFKGSGRYYCTRATNLLLSDINPSYDSDQLPGAYSTFSSSSSYSGSTLDDFNLTTLLDTISTGEHLTNSPTSYFIGQSADEVDGAPTAKTITGLASIRGLAPAEPTKQGSYSSAGVAYYGMTHDLRSDLQGTQNVRTSVVSLASALPEVSVKIAGQVIKIVPFAKSVGGKNVDTYTNFQPTNTIVDWYVESISETSGVFRINYEDVEQGADHDMDMVVKYSYQVESCGLADGCPTDNSQRLAITLDSIAAGGDIVQHAGYIISGSNHDGLYLEVRDKDDIMVHYKFDTPDSSVYTARELMTPSNNNDLPLHATRYFYPNSSGLTASFLPSPLWYAAKWGSFADSEVVHQPLKVSQWDIDGDEIPDAYFPVTNTGELKSQMAKAFDSGFTDKRSTTAPVYNSNFLQQGTLVYQSSFKGGSWSGDIQAFEADSDGNFSSSAKWSAANLLDSRPSTNPRKIFTRNAGQVFDFDADEVGSSLAGSTDAFSLTQLTLLLGAKEGTDTEKLDYVKTLISYLGGDRSHESENFSNPMRPRDSALGDVINSTPYYVAAANGHDVEKDLIIFGANDGMVHLLDAYTGEELMAYVPSNIYDKLHALAQIDYTHQYSVDGGINAYTEPATASTKAVTTVVGALGTGAKGLYAMDVSDLRTPSSSQMKWEITPASTGFDKMGYTSAAPTIAKLKNGKVGVIFANGYNAVDGSGTIYIADLDDGTLIKKLETGTLVADDPQGKNRPNAMASPAVIDSNNDGIADRIYAGDLYGNMWAFDISDKLATNWKNAITTNEPLFKAISPSKNSDAHYIAQPITTRPSVSFHPNGITSGILLAFGTGKYIETVDNTTTNQATQSFYVIWDKLQGNAIASLRQSTNANKYTTLLSQSIDKEDTNNRLLSEHLIDWTKDQGFYLDLLNTQKNNQDNAGERQVTNSVSVDNKVIFTTLLPNTDPCSAGGAGWYMVMNLHTGQTWYKGQPVPKNEDGTENEDEIADDSSHQKQTGIPSGVATILSFPDISSGVSPDTVEQTNCFTLSTGESVCYNDPVPATGRITWQQLY